MVWESGHTLVECPFCKKHVVAAFRRPRHRQGHTSRISAGAKVTFRSVDEKVYVQGDCPNCGAKNQDIQKVYDGKAKKAVDHAAVVARLRAAGLPTRIEG